MREALGSIPAPKKKKTKKKKKEKTANIDKDRYIETLIHCW
jgi:hypothetical protein